MIEIHSHTTASDGDLDPADLVAFAADKGVSILAVTDHDTVSGLDEAAAAGAVHGVDFLPGIEITVGVPHGSMHLLAYLPDAAPESLTDRLDELGALRQDRIHRIVERLNDLGVPLRWESVTSRVTGRFGRPHVAAALVDEGHVADMQEAFDVWLADGRPAHVPQKGLEAREAIALVREAGGCPVLAHPASLRLPPRHLASFAQQLTSYGLGGIEVHRPEHRPEQRDDYGAIARRLRLIPCGGSDFHRPTGPFAIGDTGHPGIPAESVDRIRAELR